MRRGHRWAPANNRCRSKQERKFYRQQENLKQPRGGEDRVQLLFGGRVWTPVGGVREWGWGGVGALSPASRAAIKLCERRSSTV